MASKLKQMPFGYTQKCFIKKEMVFKGISSRLNQRKVKVFAIFLLCSFFAWTLSKLSENYESRANFELLFTNFPDSLLLNTTEPHEIGLKLRTSGFKFLGYGLSKGRLKVNLSKVNKDDQGYYLKETTLKPQFERQLSNTISLLELEDEKLYLPLYKVATKEVKIVPNITLDLKQNHILEGKLVLEPAFAVLKGPSKEIRHIDKIESVPHVFEALTSSFTKILDLEKPQNLENTELLTTNVTITGKVVRFSEKAFTIPIKAINEPSGFSIRMFPSEVQLVCKASVATLKEIKSSDFEVVADYTQADSETSTIPLYLRSSPEGVYSAVMVQKEIEFVLEGL